jgi:hypothetical protein
VEVIQGFLHFFDGPKRTLDLALRPSCGAATILPTGEMRLHLDIEIAHDLVKHLAARHWTVVQVQGVGAPTEREPGIGLGGHRAEQEFERGFYVLTIGAVIFLIRHTTAVIDDTIEHQRRGPLAGIHPRGDLELLEIRGTDVKLPQLVAVLCLEAHGRGFSAQGLPIQPPPVQVPIHGGNLEHPFGGLDPPLGRLEPIVF